ncbi:MAG TPA: serine/threonine-protein kinase [Thermoanaerobaculia bacterium]|jgi:serine/threonine-protein kinase
MSTPNLDPEATARVESDVRFTPRPIASDAQFAPGAIIAGRYRIGGILGAGGMGEVYRADDTKLGQPVALKFLPARLARDPLLLARLHDEVRHGRQIAHPNVCRIYDIVEWEGAHFLAMEMVDGEDLARLLRRIGRLAHDKAVDIARGVAAGLMAAHAKGILHRDLKPANVMIDSHGEARITDFGLALPTDADQEGEIAGTPAYMAPELLSGSPATVQSDLYALGLVMYELFTGKRVHAGRSFHERVRDTSTEITVPSAVIADLNPAVERVILRCLATDPTERPRSARAVIEALPGGDPLAAALAAGETPSPRIVAAAGTEGSLRPRTAWMLLGATVLMLVTILFAMQTALVTTNVGFDRSPEVLAHRTAEIIRTLGLPVSGPAVTYLHRETKYMATVSDRERAAMRQQFREGPPVLIYRTQYGAPPQEALLDLEPPPLLGPGRALIGVDVQGRLASLSAGATAEWKPATIDWRALHTAAGLDPATIRPATPRLVPDVPFDARAAWSATYPNNATPVHVEAATWRGIPVFFRITGAWDQGTAPREFGGRPVLIFLTILTTLAFTIGATLAWRNLRLRRGDRKGALRVAITMFLLLTVGELLSADHRPELVSELDVVVRSISNSLFWGALLFLLYIALEPYIRRRWPDTLIASTRLLAGNYRDPMVGRDLLIGIAAGTAHTFLAVTSWLAVERFFGESATLLAGRLQVLLGTRFAVAVIPNAVASGMVQAFLWVSVMVLFSMLLRKRLRAAVAVGVLTVIAFALAIPSYWMLPFSIAISILLTLIAARYGLLAFAATQATFAMLFPNPAPLDGSWTTTLALIPIVFILTAAAFAFKTSLGTQSAWNVALLDD